MNVWLTSSSPPCARLLFTPSAESKVQQRAVSSRKTCLLAKWWWSDTQKSEEPTREAFKCSCLGQTPLHLHSAPPPPPQLAPFRREVTVSERSALFEDEPQLLLLLFVSPSLPSLPLCLSPSPSSVAHFFLIFSGAFFVGVTLLNGTMQPSVKLKLLVSLELLKRGFYTCMHSYTLPYAIDIAN